jgi:hypothetical protein
MMSCSLPLSGRHGAAGAASATQVASVTDKKREVINPHWQRLEENFEELMKFYRYFTSSALREADEQIRLARHQLSVGTLKSAQLQRAYLQKADGGIFLYRQTLDEENSEDQRIEGLCSNINFLLGNLLQDLQEKQRPFSKFN